VTGCRPVRELLAGYSAGRLQPDDRVAVAAHLEGCADCRRAAAVEEGLSAALRRLPGHAAPDLLKRRLERLVTGMPEAPDSAPDPSLLAPPAPPPSDASSRRARRSIWLASVGSALAAAAIALLSVRGMPPRRPAGGPGDMVAEAVNDHLRVVGSTRPIEIESGGIHQVKPWFTGRLDFAPRVTFSGDDDFPLVGGSLGYFRDRRAAVFVFKRRLHTATLLVFPAEGLEWPGFGLTKIGRLSVAETASRGFTVLLWQDAGLGYALISDVNNSDLETLASRINPD
jgi:anti-sigma factor RsiW